MEGVVINGILTLRKKRFLSKPGFDHDLNLVEFLFARVAAALYSRFRLNAD
jgi:hypothetical protein